MDLEKKLKNVGKTFAGIVLATSLFLACDTGGTITSANDEEEKEENKTEQTAKVGDIQGKVVVPIVENNYWSWQGKEDVTIFIDGKERGRSIANGLFYIAGVETGARELNAIYKKYFLSEKVGVFVKGGVPNSIDENIELIPESDEFEIVYGIIYSDSSKRLRYNGRLRIPGGLQLKTDVSEGIYAFQGSVNGQEMIADLSSKISKRIKFFDKQNPSKESWQINLGNNWVVEQNGYIVE